MAQDRVAAICALGELLTLDDGIDSSEVPIRLRRET